MFKMVGVLLVLLDLVTCAAYGVDLRMFLPLVRPLLPAG